MRKVYLLLIPFLIFLSCNSSGTSTELASDVNHITFDWGDMSKTSQLSGKALGLYEKLTKPRAIALKNNYLIVADDDPSLMIHVVDILNPFNMQRKGIKGYGPGEIMHSTTIDSGLNDSTFWIYSVPQMSWFEFNLYDQERLSSNHIKLGTESRLTSVFPQWIYNRNMIACTVDKSTKLEEYDIDGSSIRTFGNWSDHGLENIPNEVTSMLYTGIFKTNEKHDEFLLSSIYLDHFEVFDLKRNKTLIFDGPDQITPVYTIATVQNSPVFSPNLDRSHFSNSDVAIGDQFYYLLYSGKQWERAPVGKHASNKIIAINKETLSPELIKLDRDIVAFCIDNKTQRLYAISFEENPDIYVYQL
uniref:BF3164 family lipoprotein n=3 Tax=Roseivirga sp. TaxID=1964215 RepID=UPI00404889C0